MKNIMSIMWSVDPIIFQAGPVRVAYYGLLFAGGLAISYYIMAWIFKLEKEPIKNLDRFAMFTILGAIIGARLGHILFYGPYFGANGYLSNPLSMLKVWEGGLASHGGALGILISIAIYQRKSTRSYIWLLDKIAIPTALTGAMIRFGNLMNSEIYGAPTDLPWGFRFMRENLIYGTPLDQIVPKHPTQIYESLAYLLIFVFLVFLFKRNYKTLAEGKLLGYFFILVFGVRFFVEFIKYHQSDLVGMESLLNMGQLLSLPMVAIGFYLIFRKKNKAV